MISGGVQQVPEGPQGRAAGAARSGEQGVDGTQGSTERGEKSSGRLDPGMMFILVMGFLLALQLLWVVSTLSWAAVDPPAASGAVTRPLHAGQAPHPASQ